MYRAPEMLDLYQNFPINEQQDIWVGASAWRISTFREPFKRRAYDWLEIIDNDKMQIG